MTGGASDTVVRFWDLRMAGSPASTSAPSSGSGGPTLAAQAVVARDCLPGVRRGAISAYGVASLLLCPEGGSGKGSPACACLACLQDVSLFECQVILLVLLINIKLC